MGHGGVIEGFQGLDRTCNSGRPEDDNLPAWTQETLAQIWVQVSGGHVDWNGFIFKHNVEEHGLPEARGWRSGRERHDHVHVGV